MSFKPGYCPLLVLVVFCGLAVFATGCGGGAGSVSGSASSGGSGSLSAAQLLALAELAGSRGDDANALQLYRQVLALEPAGSAAGEAQLGIGGLLVEQGDYETARTAFQAAAAIPGDDRPARAQLATGDSYVAEFEALDAGTTGFVDESAASEFLTNQEAVEAFRTVAENADAPAALRASALYSLGEAYFRGRSFAQARQAFTQFLGMTSDEMAGQRAHLQQGLAYLQENDSAGARREFKAAGAAAQSAATPGTAAYAQFGGLAGPPVSVLGLSDLVITVQRELATARDSEQLDARAELGVALTMAYVDNQRTQARARLSALVSKPVPVGDLAAFQVGELLRLDGDRDGALAAYEAMLASFPASAFAQRAQARLGEILFEVLGRQTATKARVSAKLLANLVVRLRAAVGSSQQPEREARTRALELLGRLDSEGIPVPLTVAMPGGLEPAVAGAPYRQELSAFGGQGAVGWSLAPGTQLPAGLALSAAGVLSGTPTTPGRMFVTPRVTDSAGQFDARPMLLTVEPLRLATLPRLADAILGEDYRATLVAEGQAPFTFEVAQVRRVGANNRLVTLPGFVPGLALSSGGTISGRPTEASGNRPYYVALRVRDGAGRRQAAFVALYVTARGLAKARVPAGSHDPVEDLNPMGPAGGGSVPAGSAHGAATPLLLSTPGLELATVPALGQQLGVTPDGRTLVVITGLLSDTLSAIDTATGQTRTLQLPGPPVLGRFPLSLAISPDGRRAAVGLFSNSQGQMLLVDLEQPQVTRTVETGVRTLAVAFTPDGRLAVARSAERVTSLEVQSGATAAVDIQAVGSGSSLAVFPDSKRVLVAGDFTSNLAAVVELDSGSRITYELPGPGGFADVLPDGRHAVLNEFAGNRLFVLDLVTGTVASSFLGLTGRNLALSADGSLAVVPMTGSAELAVVELPGGRVRRVRMPFELPGLPVALSPDGRTAAVFGQNGGVNQGALVDTGTLQVRLVPAFGAFGGNNRRVAVFSPDGARVYLLLRGTGSFDPTQVLSLELASAAASVGLKRRPLAPAVAGAFYQHRFEALGGTPDYRFGPAGALAGVPGLALEAGGMMAGTPAEADLYAVEGSVSDSAGSTVTFVQPLLVRESNAPAEPLVLVTPELANAEAGRPCLRSLSAIGGLAPYGYEVVSGSLPGGMTFSREGLLSGTPSRIATAVLSLRVTDAAGSSDTRQLTFHVVRTTPFEPAVAYDLLAPALAVQAIDLDRDGRDDLAVGHDSPTTNVSLFLTDAGGTLGQPTNLQIRDVGQPGTADAGSVYALLSADFNGDQIPDMAVQTFPGLGTSGRVFTRPCVVPLLGDGRGGFTMAPALLIPRTFGELATGDLDADGRDDLAMACPDDIPFFGVFATLFVERSSGDGTFSEAQRVVTSSPLQMPQRAAIADFTGDGRMDVAVAVSWEDLTWRLLLYPGRGDGTVDAGPSSVLPLEQSTDTRLAAFVAADLNRDGHPDVVASDDIRGGVYVFLSGTTGGLSGPRFDRWGSLPVKLVVTDLNGDGAPDLIAPVAAGADPATEPGAVELRFNLGDGTFDLPQRMTVGEAPGALTLGDFNADGLPDLAIADMAHPVLNVLLGSRPPESLGAPGPD